MRNLTTVFLCAIALWCFQTVANAQCSLTTISVGPPKVLACTSTSATTLTVPSDWNSANNTVEVIGGGGGGQGGNAGTGCGGAGGGGGAYSKSVNLSLPPGTVTIHVGSAGAGGSGGCVAGSAGGDTWFNASSFPT